MNKDILILEMIDEVQHLQKEIIALRYYLIKDYPFLENDLLSDITPLFYSDINYQEYIEKLGFDPFQDKEYLKDLKQIKKYGITKCYPFSIYY